MTLLELLVRDLERWPLNVTECSNYPKSNMYAWIDTGKGVARMEAVTRPSVTPPEHVTREQYEAALAASRRPEWNGKDLPPVGCECELVNFFGEDFPEFVGDSGDIVKIIGNGFTNSVPVAFYEVDGGRGRILAYAVSPCFRPIRNEAERKREDIGLALYHAINWNAEGELASPSRMEDYRKAYDAIAAGKIPGIKLAD